MEYRPGTSREHDSIGQVCKSISKKGDSTGQAEIYKKEGSRFPVQRCLEPLYSRVWSLQISSSMITEVKREDKKTQTNDDTTWFTSDDVQSATSDIGNAYMWTGRRYDAESDLYYFRARMWNTAMGRFINRDPLGSRQPPACRGLCPGG